MPNREEDPRLSSCSPSNIISIPYQPNLTGSQLARNSGKYIFWGCWPLIDTAQNMEKKRLTSRQIINASILNKYILINTIIKVMSISPGIVISMGLGNVSALFTNILLNTFHSYLEKILNKNIWMNIVTASIHSRVMISTESYGAPSNTTVMSL